MFSRLLSFKPFRLVTAILTIGCIAFAQEQGNMETFTISATTFENGKDMPSKYTCQGKNVSPTLFWSHPPEGTESFALIVDDPDAPDPAAPQRVWVHWVLYNIPAGSTGLPEDVAVSELPTGTKPGKNDWGKTGYGGPCPPIGKHRYFFKLYALSTTLPDLDEPNKARLLKAMQGHVLGETEMIGTYKKK